MAFWIIIYSDHHLNLHYLLLLLVVLCSDMLLSIIKDLVRCRNNYFRLFFFLYRQFINKITYSTCCVHAHLIWQPYIYIYIYILDISNLLLE